MTIKELCDNSKKCYECPFIDICSLNDTIYHLITTNEQYNLNCTKAIIETAKMLQEDEEIAKTFIEDVEAVKDQLPVSESEV